MTRTQLAPHHGMGMNAGGRVICGKRAQFGQFAQAIRDLPDVQRGAKRQPGGRASGSGGVPGIAARCWRACRAWGTELIRPSV